MYLDRYFTEVEKEREEAQADDLDKLHSKVEFANC